MQQRFTVMEIHPCTSFNLLPLLLLLLFLATSIAPDLSPPPPLSVSVFSAAQLLRDHGYSLFANALVSESYRNDLSAGTTMLAPTDFAFSSANFSSSLPPPPPPPLPSAAALLHYHTLRILSLNWVNLSSRPDGDELPTNYKNNSCIFLFKDENGNPVLSSSKNRTRVVGIRHPDLYADDSLTIHGVDGILDPAAAKKCSISGIFEIYSTAGIIQSPVGRSSLDHAIRVLRIRGYNVVASAMALRWSDLLTVKSVTIFAPSDTALFAVPHGFRYDFFHHIIPRRLRSVNSRMFPDGALFETLSPDKTVFVQFGDKGIRINGVQVAGGGELYYNRWIVIYPIPVTLDDAIEHFPSKSPENHFPDAKQMGGREPVGPPDNQIPAMSVPETPVYAPRSGRTRIPAVTWTPSPAPNSAEVFKMHCQTEGPNNIMRALQGITVENDSGDLFCPVSNAPDL